MLQQVLLAALKMFAARRTQKIVGEGPSLKDELSSVLARGLAGIILAAVIIYSLIQLGSAVQDLLLTLPFGRYWEIGLLVMIAVGCSIGLIMTFKAPAKAETLLPANASHAFPYEEKFNVLTDFAVGFAKAYREENSRRVIETPVYEQKPNMYLINQ